MFWNFSIYGINILGPRQLRWGGGTVFLLSIKRQEGRNGEKVFME